MTVEPPPPMPMPRFDWERIVRASHLHRSVKGTALVLATYANADGTSIRPGVSNLARDCSAGTATVKRHLNVLREGGFIVQVKQGYRREKEADEYMLTYCPVRSGGVRVAGAANLWGSLVIPSDEALQGSPVIPSDGMGEPDPHPLGIISDVTGDHFGGPLGITCDPPPEHHQPTPDQPLTFRKVSTERVGASANETESSSGSVVEYRPASPAYAAWREQHSRRRRG